MQRSSLAEVRNPILALPSAARLAELPPEAQDAICALLDEMREDSRARAEHAWKKHKAPVAAYWRAVSTYAGHISKALKRMARERAAR